MTQQLKSLLSQLSRWPRRLLGESVALEPPDAFPDERLTPREAFIEGVAATLRRALWTHGLIALALVLVGALAQLFGQTSPMAAAHQLLLSGVVSPDDVALGLLLVLLFINICAFLVLLVGVRGREFWAIVAALALVLLNLAALLAFGYTLGLLAMAFGLWATAAMLRDWRAFRLNPVMMKELRGRMRGARAFVVMGVYLGLMSLFTVLVYAAYPNLSRYSSPVLATGELGRVLFNTVIGIELVLILFIVPAFTTGAITGERERKTYDLLRTTLLPAPAFIVGKLESALSYIFLLLLAAIPIQSIAFLFGGVGEVELLIASVILGVTALVLGALGIFLSSTTERTLTASVRTYLIVAALIFIVPPLLAELTIYNDALTGFAGFSTTAPYSPIMETALIYLGLLVASINPISTWVFSQMMLVERQAAVMTTVTLASDGSQIPLLSPWVLFAIIYVMLSGLLLLGAMRRMRRMRLD